MILSLCALGGVLPVDAAHAPQDEADVPTHVLAARVVAVGIPRIQGIRQVGMFHSGGPIPGNPDFLMKTRPGRVLDPQRLLVASGADFGNPSADIRQAPGTILSIDPRGADVLKIPPRFAERGGQSEAANGLVRVYSAHSSAFLNGVYNAGARTASQTAVSGPRYISVNNGFGRPWFANSPFGAKGVGTVSVTDPNGKPLDNAPSAAAGGVFFGTLTNRKEVPVNRTPDVITKKLSYKPSGQLTPGSMVKGALGTAFMGASPDGSGFAVFAVATADGSVLQLHVQDGVDGLAPPGTVAPGAVDGDLGVIGMAFKWIPDRALYLTDQARNRVALLQLKDDARQFKLDKLSYITHGLFNRPVDISAAVPEVANPRFASHTTIAGDSDLYIANRGDGALLRMDQSGKVLARGVIHLPGAGPLGADRIRGMSVSSDGQRVWLSVQGELPGYEGLEGAVIEVSAFDAVGVFGNNKPLLAGSAPSDTLVQAGATAFNKSFTPAEGLGPLFNARSCVACHSEPSAGGMSGLDQNFAVRVARVHPDTGRLEGLDSMNSPVARRHSLRELGLLNAPVPGIPRKANVTSLRMPPALYDVGQLDRIPEAAIMAHAVSKGDGIKGRPNRVVTASGEQRIGRYGWKADVADLNDMVANAYANELGITSPLAPRPGQDVEDNGTLVQSVVAYLRSLRKPQP